MTTTCNYLACCNTRHSWRNVVLLPTGLTLIVTPGYVSRQSLIPISRGIGGHMFCALLANRYLLFTIAKVSILLVTCLAMERWCCVLRPVKYMIHFSRRRRIVYVVGSWILSCALQIHKMFEKRLVGNKCETVEAPYGETGAQALIAIYGFANFIVPCVITWLTFAHIKFRSPNSLGAGQKSDGRRVRQKTVLQLCALTAAVFTLSWLPAQVSYTLFPFGITDVSSSLHKWWNTIAFLNSCVNPLIYWYYHKEYRNAFFKLFCGCKALQFQAIIPLHCTDSGSHDLPLNHKTGESPPLQTVPSPYMDKNRV